ncbi:hypothetical protein [Halioxenophilus sp. WMMB6]|uniref:hypothetical protein n=1 Tax=Halioxenophilus sp. WMMB6 TaxID=3073815 RepID=UPI00295F03DA|nr:hypothetical protein [Halioxenophilus sp. WMMB6]
MLRISALLLLLSPQVLLAAEEHHFGQFSFYTEPQLPQWVKPLAPGKSHGLPQGQNVEYLLLDSQIHALPGDYQDYEANRLIELVKLLQQSFIEGAGRTRPAIAELPDV